MKKKLVFGGVVVLSVCLMGFRLGGIVPASQASVAAAPAVSPAAFAQPVAILVTGLVCVLFGLLAVAPLLLNDTAP